MTMVFVVDVAGFFAKSVRGVGVGVRGWRIVVRLWGVFVRGVDCHVATLLAMTGGGDVALVSIAQ